MLPVYCNEEIAIPVARCPSLSPAPPSCTGNQNDYQIEQAQNAEQAARKFGVDIEVAFAGNDAINQSTQILRAIQAAPEDRPDAIIFEPVGGTALPQVARAAVSSGIARAWPSGATRLRKNAARRSSLGTMGSG